MEQESKSFSLPRRLVVTLRVGAVFFALANVVCVAILSYAYLRVKYQPKTLEVKGSAIKAIVSDIVSWNGTITTRDLDLTIAYDKLQADADRVKAFLIQAGVPETEITFSAITTDKIYRREVVQDGGSNRNTVVQTSQVESYILTQRVSIESSDVVRVPAVSRSITSLIKNGVEISSGSPTFRYSKLADLKIDILAEATRDATTRATQIVENANGQLGKLVDARMGVMQINAKGANEVSSTGVNDTTSLEKEIMAVVTARFEVD